MRLWSLHPKYLDPKGIVALWREGLLAQNVLAGKTKGYKNHPQLDRFKQTNDPVAAISTYLWGIAEEAKNRRYTFNKDKIVTKHLPMALTVTSGQAEYEVQHLLKKLKQRDSDRYSLLKNISNIELHPIFVQTHGDIETWEIL